MRQISAGHDGSRLDLRTFVSLANIKIPFYYLFKSPAPHESRNGAYELFPHSMETLDIYFGLRSSLLHTADEDREKMIGPHAAFEPWTYEWIIQFAHNKHRCFPKLWRLNAEEDTLGNPRTESLVEWSGTELQTKSMREIWDSAGISGTISFRRFPSNRSVRSLIHQSNPRADI
ncbi:hypothetical protein BU16DRAFT_562412 [Lophium mytilinum]|uniref:Uncharacterized protein n=1 Tax=Lophium mytilinum TaxID=390894 RepID=A0A6A6QSR3_9PEZI|nr:hypothetical protein BU16DRAFT_562412 [Lophium mytilinum]